MDEKKQQHIFDARCLMRQQHSGVLSTISLSMNGFPFGSIIPFLMTEKGDLVIYASDIAQHSRNMKADSKVSLCVYDAAQNDSQANARVTVLAHAFPDEVNETHQQHYFELFPQARAYQNTHDFRFYLLKTERVRYIGGFGEIYWFSNEEWDSAYPLSEQVKGIVDHMHDDHMDAIVAMCDHFLGLDVAEDKVHMASCFGEGFHITVAAENERNTHFIPFEKAVSEEYSVRAAMVALTRKSKLPA
ncbi:MAG: DUF2470 domain-containing protein [Pseudomonadota bacterium]